MAKHGSLKYQLNQRLNELKRCGQSKHQAKQQEKERCREEGRSWNPARTEGIFSYRTCDAYRESTQRFLIWEKEHYPEQKILRGIPREHMGEYLQERIDRGLSAWTLKADAAALAKIFDCSSRDFEVKLPERRIENRVKNRRVIKDFSEKNNRDLVTLSKGSGLRRHEIKALKPENIFEKDGRVCVKVERGKGGKPRVAPVLREYEQDIREIKERTQRQEKVIENIPKQAPIHAYRGEYAKNLYQEIKQERGVGKDRERDISAQGMVGNVIEKLPGK
jgi:integrase